MRINARDQRSGTSRRMGRLGEVHSHEGESGRQACGKPLESWVRILLQVKLEDSCHDHADKSAEKMAKDQGTRLRQRDIYSAVTKNCRSTLVLH